MTNAEFASRVGVDASFASLLRNGHRMPGADLFIEIIAVFELDAYEAMEAYRTGPEGYSEYLRTNVFDVPVEAGPSGGTGTDEVG